LLPQPVPPRLPKPDPLLPPLGSHRQLRWFRAGTPDNQELHFRSLASSFDDGVSLGSTYVVRY